jgi:uncharacterized heparinase superfamily protein
MLPPSRLTPSRLTRGLREAMARLPSLNLGSLPDAPAPAVRDPWPGDAARGARLLRGELELDGAAMVLRPGVWTSDNASMLLRAHAHGFTWLRDLRNLGTDAARAAARALVADWISAAHHPAPATRPDVAGARITAWLAHWDFFAASATDAFRQKLMPRLMSEARGLSARLPPEEVDARALTALKGLIAAGVAMPGQAAFLSRALRFLPPAINSQVMADGCHAERSPAVQFAALQDLVEIRSLLQAAQATPPTALGAAIERMAPALRLMRHGDGGLTLFNGSDEGANFPLEQALGMAARGGRPASSLPEGGFHRMQAGRTVLIIDGGAPAPPGLDRFAHAGTLSFEISVGRDRLVVNCGAAPASGSEWRDALRATAAHSTLVIADTNSSELKPDGLGRRPEKVEVQRQEANGAHWLEASHDGWGKPFGAVHRRRLYLAESGEDIRGEDSVEAETPQPFVLRFHLHPSVSANVQQDGEAVLLRTASGGWRLRADVPGIALEESVYFGGGEPRRSEQVVIPVNVDGPQTVKWAITRVG